MTGLAVEVVIPMATNIIVTEDALTAELSDGRQIVVPLEWYPRLTHATQRERENWEFLGGGTGIHWPDLDEDISIAGLIAGRKSGENAKSFNQWLAAKKAGRPLTLDALSKYERSHPKAD